MPAVAAKELRPRRVVVEHPSLTVEGRQLKGVQLGGWVYGPELGTAPAILLVGGITALSLIMLFWPLISKILARIRGD